MNKILAVIFDFGGVIAEKPYFRPFVDIIADFLKNKGIYLSSEQKRAIKQIYEDSRQVALLSMREITLEEILFEIYTYLGLHFDYKLIKEGYEYFVGQISSTARQEARDTLKALKDMDIKIGLISNTFTDYPRRALKQFGLLDYFDVITLSYEVSYRKPSPVIYRSAIDILGVSPRECLFVADEIDTDLWGAKNMGLLTAYIKSDDSWTYWRKKIEEKPVFYSIDFVPDYVIKNLLQVVEIIERLNKVGENVS